jgi:peptidoglycan/LPS O-acetylase OafA/YrhL
MAERARPDRVPELDGLRGVAILLVLLFHYISIEGLTKTGSWSFILQRIVIMGWTGVDLFFVLSGFLIGGILIDARGSPNYFKTFYARRFFRIIPIYYLWILGYVLLVSVGGAFVRAHSHSGAVLQLGPAIYAHFLFLQNLGFVHVTGLAGAWFSHTWSLAIEEQFYLVAPLLIWFLSPRRLFIFLVVIIAGAPLLRLGLLQYFHAAPGLVGVGMPTRADSFAVGILAAILWRNAAIRAGLATHPRVLYLLLGLFSAGAVVLWRWSPQSLASGMESVGYTCMAFFYGVILLLVLARPTGLLAATARISWLRELGSVSYCVYLIHLVVDVFCHAILLHDTPRFSNGRAVAVSLFAGFLTYGIAKFSWIILERPLLRRGHSFSY